MKLIKLTTDHFIIIDETTEGQGRAGLNYVIPTGMVVNMEHPPIEYSAEWQFSRIITHSTKPFRQFAPLTINDVGLAFLDLNEVLALTGNEPVNEKARREVDRYRKSTKSHDRIAESHRFNGFMAGYNQCLQDNSKKVFTEADMQKAIELARKEKPEVSEHDPRPYYVPAYSCSEIIQQLQKKDEWDIEIIDNTIKLKP